LSKEFDLIGIPIKEKATMMSDELRLKLPDWFSEKQAKYFTELLENDPEAYARELYELLSAHAAGAQFRNAHPELGGNREAALAITTYAESNGWAITIDNLNRAFEVLRREGRLQLEEEAEDAGASRVAGTSPIEACPTVADDRDGWSQMNDREFRQALEDLDADVYKRKLLSSPWFAAKAEAVLSR
jgi:hypothetical protein